MLQSSLFDGLAFDPFALKQDDLAAPSSFPRLWRTKPRRRRARPSAPDKSLAKLKALHAAELAGLAGRAGVAAAGAFADLIVVEGNPLKDIGVLGGQGDKLSLIMKGGAIVKDELGKIA